LVLLPAAVLLHVVAASSPAIAQRPPDDAHSLCVPTGPAPEGGYAPYDGPVWGRGEKVIGGVPGYGWRHGCGPTAAGMVVGYWDGNGFPALIPGNAAVQNDAVNQAIATGNGEHTHYSDYSLPMDHHGSDPEPLPDLSEPPPGDEHASNCIADFMMTSWSAADNFYGWSWSSDVDDAFIGYTSYVNATYGANYEATSWREPWGEFTWESFVAEIDADRPMVFLVDYSGDGETDHFVAVIGYRNTYGYPEYACLDTWSPVGSVRWERFWEVSDSHPWGIDAAIYYSLAGCHGDLDGDWDIDLADLAKLLSRFGMTDATYGEGDLNDDGSVDLVDLAALLTVYGSSCE
jgi:hypothetical protein